MYTRSMDALVDLLSRPWPWYVAGPLLGLVVPILLLIGNRTFGLSSNLQHLCAVFPTRWSYLRYDWRRVGGWNLATFAGVALGGAIAWWLIPPPEGVVVAAATEAALAGLGVPVDGGLAPDVLVGADAFARGTGLLVTLAAGLLVGFGTRWAGGCTSGHGMAGLASRQLLSLVAVIGFFVGGLLMTHLVFPWALPALVGAS